MLGLLMNLENINIEKLPIDVRKTFKRYQVMHAEKTNTESEQRKIFYLL